MFLRCSKSYFGRKIPLENWFTPLNVTELDLPIEGSVDQTDANTIRINTKRNRWPVESFQAIYSHNSYWLSSSHICIHSRWRRLWDIGIFCAFTQWQWPSRSCQYIAQNNWPQYIRSYRLEYISKETSFNDNYRKIINI